MKQFLILLALVISCKSFTINTQYGPITGASRVSALGRNYFSFQRIPYMKPPVGRLRFRNAEVPDNWTTPLDCTQEGPSFPQIDLTRHPVGGQFAGDLDSMHINVYTNNLNPTTRYPVLVWIHGGGFRTGSAGTEIYGPDYFVEQNVVLVSFNYRLQAFGFLSLDDPTLGIPGNAGFKDQVLALKWIKDNIGAFGGDNQNITIFGQSSGGGCAHFHIISEASRDLFQRSIIMSGSAFNNMYSTIPRRNWALRLARSLNYTGPAIDSQILSFLEVADPEDIFTQVGLLMTPDERNDERLLNAFGPTIEPYVTDTAFLLDHPENLAPNSWGNNVDILIGATSFENGALTFVIQNIPGAIDGFSNFTSWVPYNLGMRPDERVAAGKALKLAYYGLLEPTQTHGDGLIILSNEFAFIHSNHRIVQQRWRSPGTGRSFVYRFDATTNNNCFSVINRVDPRYTLPIHMDDLCHLFKTEFAPVPARGSSGWNMIEEFVGIFTRFASTGNPGIQGWTPSTGEQGRAPLFGYNIRAVGSSVGELPEVQRMEVWDSFYTNNLGGSRSNL